jgi:RNA polymerase sigma-70 factor (ECF subfamily)
MFAGVENPLRDGRPQVWNQLIDAIGPSSLLVLIEGRLSAALRATLTAEDIFQDALLHAWRDREMCEWRGLRAFRAWMLTIIDRRIHYAAEQLAAQKRGGGAGAVRFAAVAGSTAGPTTGGPESIPAGSTTPSRVAIFREQAAAMHAALEALPDEQREIVRLRLFEQLTLDEIAARLDLTLAAVRYRFRRGAEAYQRLLRAQFSSRSLPQPHDFTAAGGPNPSP